MDKMPSHVKRRVISTSPRCASTMGTVSKVGPCLGQRVPGEYVGNRKHGLGCYTWADGAQEEGQTLG